MSPQKFSSSPHLFKRTTLVAGVVILAGLFALIQTASNQSQDQNPSSEKLSNEIEMVPPGQEKKVFIMFPPHVPLKVKVKNENSKRWTRDLEIEVTNSSTRPIYFLDFFVTLPEIRVSGIKVGFWMHYGRAELLVFSTPITPEDVPLQPGEKYTFKLQNGEADGWDYLKDKEGKPEPRIIEIGFQRLNFGDGTGYLGSGGTRKNIHRKINLNNKCGPPSRSPDRSSLLAFSFLPASSLPVNFFKRETFDVYSFKSVLMPDLCCTGEQSSCVFVKESTFSCARTCDSNPNRPNKEHVGCTDPQGQCMVYESRYDTCTDPGSGLPLSCLDTFLYSCFEGAGAEDTRALH